MKLFSRLIGTRPVAFPAVATLAALAMAACNGGGAKPGDMTGPSSNRPVILSFTASPPNLPAAGPCTLSWQVKNATSLSIDQGVGAVTGTSKDVTVSGTTIYALTATNSYGSTTTVTAVVVGQNPASHNGRKSVIISPTSGESFVAPTSLRLVAFGYDQGIDTNSPTEGHGNNAGKVQFFVDDNVVLEVDGQSAEFSIFKGFTSGVAAGQHRVWARSIYSARGSTPDEVLDSLPAIITVSAPPSYAQTVDLSDDVTLSGATGYELKGTADGRIRLNGNGHRIASVDGATGPLTLQFVDVYNLGQTADTSRASIDVATSGTITIEDSHFDASNPLHVAPSGTAAASIQRNLFRSNMRQPIGQLPGSVAGDAGSSFPVVSISGNSTAAKVFAGNNIGAGWVELINVKGWVVGGDTDADSNVLIGPRVGIYPSGDVHVRRNYSHHVYYGGWSQGSNFELGGAGTIAEHNVIWGGSWPVRGVGDQFRYNLVLDAGHEWLWIGDDGAAVHHNIFVGGEADIGGIRVIYNPNGPRIYNNTIDGLGTIGLAVLIDPGTASLSMTSNLLTNVPSPGVSIMTGTLTADYNLFYQPAMPYSDGRAKPAHDVDGQDPMLTGPSTQVFDLDEVGVWQRNITVRDILGHYRTRYTPRSGSPAIDAGDPAGGGGNDIGAVGAGQSNSDDQFGMLQ